MFGPFSTVFPGSLARSGIGSGAGRTPADAHMGCWRFNLLHPYKLHVNERELNTENADKQKLPKYLIAEILEINTVIQTCDSQTRGAVRMPGGGGGVHTAGVCGENPGYCSTSSNALHSVGE